MDIDAFANYQFTRNSHQLDFTPSNLTGLESRNKQGKSLISVWPKFYQTKALTPIRVDNLPI
jgi:hypothetical protein